MKAQRNIEFEDWYRGSYSRVFAAVHVMCGDSATAEDATHTAFVRALEKWPSIREMDSPTGWAVQVAVNASKRSFLRRAKGRRLERRVHSTTSVTDNYVDHELWDQVRALPEKQKLAIVFRYVEDLSQREIATILQVAPGTAGATLNHARSSLRASTQLERDSS